MVLLLLCVLPRVEKKGGQSATKKVDDWNTNGQYLKINVAGTSGGNYHHPPSKKRTSATYNRPMSAALLYKTELAIFFLHGGY